MLATKVTCPHCRKQLRMSKPPAVGHRVLCSHCGRSFAVPGDEGGAAVNGAAPPAPAAIREPIAPPLAAPRLIPPHDHTMSKPEEPFLIGNRQRLGIGLTLGGMLLLLTTTAGLFLFFALRKGPRDDPAALVASVPSSDAEVPAANPRDEVAPSPPPPSASSAEATSDDPHLLPDPALTPTHAPTDSERAWLPPEEQKQVNKAIDQGVEWLKHHQTAGGSWKRGPHEVGLAALPALTLLECGVPADDVRIQKAVQFVRDAIPRLDHTYQLALAILFLDRLGDPADKNRIQTCALRLAAGQLPSGGWIYTCPLLTSQQQKDLLLVMRARRPRSSLDLFTQGPGGSAPPGFMVGGSRPSLDKGVQTEPSGDANSLPSDSDSKLLPPDGKPATPDRPSPQEAKRALNRLPAALRKLPALQPPQKSHKMPAQDNSDNSNTQFAILGLLAAGRHEVPLERSYALIVQRFHVSQLHDGHWNYHFNSSPKTGSSAAMTGAGLLGLSVQYGLAHDWARPRTLAARIDDPAVEKGFSHLADFIGKPLGAKKPRQRNRADINLYFLWTVERCGVLFNRRQIGGKDWYRWGVELLLDHQHNDGSWSNGGYPGSLPIADTCFALLFLKRANLAKDLTKKLEFFMEGKQLHGNP